MDNNVPMCNGDVGTQDVCWDDLCEQAANGTSIVDSGEERFAPPQTAGASLISASCREGDLIGECDKGCRQMVNHKKTEGLAEQKHILRELHPRERLDTPWLMSFLFSNAAEACTVSLKFKLFTVQISMLLTCATGAGWGPSNANTGVLGFFPELPFGPGELLVLHIGLYGGCIVSLMTNGYKDIHEFRFGNTSHYDLLVARLLWVCAVTVTLGFGAYAYLIWMGLGRREKKKAEKEKEKTNRTRRI